MSDLSINPVALHLVSNVFSNPGSKSVEEESVQLGVGAPVVANIRERVADGEVITSTSEAQAAITSSRDLIMSDAVAALAAQGNNLPSDILDLLED